MEVGQYCESILDAAPFRALCHQFEQICSQRILNTPYTQTEAREEAYNTFRGAREFLDFLNSFVTAKNAVLKEMDDNRLAAIEAGLPIDMAPDDEVLLGDL